MNDHSSNHSGSDGEVPEVDPRELYEQIRAGQQVSILDVRNRDEYETWRIDGENVTSRQVPPSRFAQAQVTGGITDLVGDLPDPMVVVCPRGELSAEVADHLRAEGIDAANLAGGMEGWASVYVSVEIDAAGPTVVQYHRPSSGCLSYLVHDGERAAVVDPLRSFVDRYVADTEQWGLELVAAVDTHVHADHVSGVRELREATGATVFLPEKATDRGLTYDAELVGDGREIAVGDATLTAVALPGHTTEMTGYRVGDVLLSGDSLFVESVARPDLEDATHAREFARTLYETIHERILSLPAGTVLAPGHYGPGVEPAADGTFTAPLGEVRERVPLLELDEDAFVDRVAGDVGERPANFEQIIATNLGVDDVDDETAFTLELGPNNCAASADAD